MVPDFFICSIGTGGTFSGIAEILKREYKGIKTIGIEVSSSAPLYASRKEIEFNHRPHNLMGLGAGILSINTVSDLIDDVMVVDGNESWDRMKQFIAKDDCMRSINPTCLTVGSRFTVASQASSSTAEGLRSLLLTKRAATVLVRGAATYRALGR